MNVLIAEDDGASRLILRAHVQRLGYECTVAQDGAEAWELFQRSPADVLITDWMMPGMDGGELCRRVRAGTADSGHFVYVIVLTALTDREHFLGAMEQGADDYLRKPLDPIELRVRLAVAARLARQHHELAEQSARLAHMALHDGLTGLPNRTLFYDRLDHGLRRMERERRPCAVLLMDLDGFKEVNDRYGHEQGDRVLREVARRLQAAVRTSDTVARLGGDEFAAVLPGVDECQAVQAAERMLAVVRLPYDDVPDAVIGASIGAVLAVPGGEPRSDELIRRADSAMYDAKRQRAGIHLATPNPR